MDSKDSIAPELVGIRKLGFRLLSEFPRRREQVLTNRTVGKIMLVRMVLAEQMQLQRYPRDHRHKADGRKNESDFSRFVEQVTHESLF